MNQKIILVKRPDESFPQAMDYFEIISTELPDPKQLKDDEVIVKNLFCQVNAAMRVWMTGVKTYVDPVNINDVMLALCVGEVAVSRSKNFVKGDLVIGIDT
jgi:NADPH-dependent curcumin reductase CurA